MIPSKVIYESPDGGETVYQRTMHDSPGNRTLVSKSNQASWNHTRAVWHDILRDAPNDPALMQMLQQVETYYTLKNHT